MTYLSHPVRRMRDDPEPDETVQLVVEVTPADLGFAAFEETVTAAGGSVLEELPFDSYRIEIPQTGLATLCETDGVVRVETTNAIQPGDAGEDIG